MLTCNFSLLKIESSKRMVKKTELTGLNYSGHKYKWVLNAKLHFDFILSNRKVIEGFWEMI